MSKKYVWSALGFILCVAFFLRVAFLTSFNFHGDEALNASRAEFWFDFVSSTAQTTPVQWFPVRQWWQGLSFHDHPALGFAFQFVTAHLFGDSIFALRMPFVLVGVLAVFFMFLLARELFDRDEAGIVAAAIIALHPNAIMISRYALFDGLIVLWIIVSWFLFVKAFKDQRYFLAWGAAVGCALLTKYTFVFMVAFFATILVALRKHVAAGKHLLNGITLTVIILVPAIIYNVMVFATRGHFDAALSSMVGMKPVDFQLIANRAHGSSFHNLVLFFQQIWGTSGVLLSVLAACGFAYVIYRSIRRNPQLVDLMLIAQTGLLLLFFAFLEADQRFITVLLPTLTLLITCLVDDALQAVRNRSVYARVLIGGAIVIACYIGIRDIDARFVQTSFGRQLTFFEDRKTGQGYNALYSKIDTIFRGATNELSFQVWDDPQIIALQNKNGVQAAGYGWRQKHSNNAFVIMDYQLDWVAKFWLASRYASYYQLPVYDIKNLVEIMQGKQMTLDMFVAKGITEYYFIQPLSDPITENEKIGRQVLFALKEELHKSKRAVFVSETTEDIPDAHGVPVLRLFHVTLR